MPEEFNAEDAIKEAENILKETDRNKKAREIFGHVLKNKKAGIEIDPDSEKALTIRDHCIEIARSLNSLLPRPILESKIESREEAVTKLGEEIEALREMGIKPNMHAGDDDESFIGKPLKAAEYWASELFYGIHDYYIDFVFHPKKSWMHPSNRRMQAYIEFTDIYLGEGLGTTQEKTK